MPLFGFKCSDCGARFEEWVPSLSAIDQVRCAECGSRSIQRQLSRVAGLHKGGGPAAVSAAPSCSPGGI